MMLPFLSSIRVASFTDAWIETPASSWRACGSRSHLLQMRGLKRKLPKKMKGHVLVASFTDAWIETQHKVDNTEYVGVASFTDAWIETIVPKRAVPPLV